MPDHVPARGHSGVLKLWFIGYRVTMWESKVHNNEVRGNVLRTVARKEKIIRIVRGDTIAKCSETGQDAVNNSYKCGVVLRPHDSDKILSIDSFRNAFFDVRSAFGKRAMIASRAVLEFHHRVSQTCHQYRAHHSLLRDSHQVLRAQVVPQCLEQLLVTWIRILTRSCKRVYGRRKGEC